MDIKAIVSIFRELNSEERENFYAENKELFSRIGEFKYWCAHSEESDFMDKLLCPCGCKARYVSFSFGYAKYCSQKCSSKFSQDLRKETNLKRYGVPVASSLPSVKAKMNKTREEKYGSSVLIHNKEIRQKIEETNLERYGVRHYSQSEDFKLKTKKHSREKYSTDHASQRNIQHKEHLTEDYVRKQFIRNNKFEMHEFMDYFGLSVHAMFEYKKRFNIEEPNNVNLCKSQKEVYDFLAKYAETRFNERLLIKPLELDLYLPNKKIAVEYDGLMYHSFGFSTNPIFHNSENEKCNKVYHLRKTELCEEQGIQLFHIFENEWQDPELRSIWESVLLNAINQGERIYARKCKIAEVSAKEANAFLQQNHLQQQCSSAIRIGLYFENVLVSLMTFGKSRFNKNYEYELLRFCNKKNMSVVGGASKLMQYFIRTYQPKSIISYANRRWSQGHLYEKLGFSKIGESGPNYFYFHQNKKELYSRLKFQKSKLASILPNFDPTLTETENMYANGYRKIYDCGNLVYGYSV